jgi:hypothetical protein
VVERASHEAERAQEVAAPAAEKAQEEVGVVLLPSIPRTPPPLTAGELHPELIHLRRDIMEIQLTIRLL